MKNNVREVTSISRRKFLEFYRLGEECFGIDSYLRLLSIGIEIQP